MPHRCNKLISLTLCLLLLLEQTGFAQTVSLNLSNYLSQAPKPVVSDTFRPLHLRYLSYDNSSNNFQLLLDKGSSPPNSKPALEQVTQELLKYFFIGLILPNDKFWVNLRPDSPDDILDPDLEKTDIGRIFLEADVQLKQDTSRLTSPQTKEGKDYWDKLYKRARELFGSENTTIPTLTRPWIVPDEIILRESPEGAYIYKATLKVMLEEDYLSRGRSRTAPTMRTAPTYQQYTFSDPRLKELNQYSTQLIRESIIPKLTQAVNTSKRYAPLRQVYYSLILAQWFKARYRSPGSQPTVDSSHNPYIKLIDSGNLTWNIPTNNSSLITHNFSLITKHFYSKDVYFRQYQQSFKDGEYNLQEPLHTPYGQSIRRYMSGGLGLSRIPDAVTAIKSAGNPLPYFSSFRKKFLSLLMVATLAIPSIVSIPSVSDGGFKIEKKEKKVELNIKVVEELISAIRKNGGKITFADYMSLCLYGPGGYYSGGVVNIGDGGGMNEKDDGDFGTFPEISPHAFGYSLAEKIHKMWKDMGNPGGFQIVEMGAGNGTMAKMILEHIQKKYPEFMNNLSYTIIEISPELIERQKKVMQDTGYPVKWVLGSAINMQSKVKAGVIISNELVDAFPVRLVREDSSGKLKEVFVIYQDGKFVEVLGDVSDPGIYEYIKMLEKEVPDKNTLHSLLSRNFPVNLNMLSWQEAISRSLKTGYVITIDYGFMGIPTEASGLRVYGNDNFDPVDLARDPEKFIYGYPGSVDITTDTNYPILKRYGKKEGLIPTQFIPQGEFFKPFREYMRQHDRGYWEYGAEFPQLIHQSDGFFVLIQAKGAPVESGSSPIQNPSASSAAESLDDAGLFTEEFIGNSIWWHGTPAPLKLADLDIFKTKGDAYYHGFFITVDRKHAERYRAGGSAGNNKLLGKGSGNLYQIKLRDNLRILDETAMPQNETYLLELIENLEKKYSVINEKIAFIKSSKNKIKAMLDIMFEFYESKLPLNKKSELRGYFFYRDAGYQPYEEAKKVMTQALIEIGIDGIGIIEEYDDPTLILFNPREQIKSRSLKK